MRDLQTILLNDVLAYRRAFWHLADHATDGVGYRDAAHLIGVSPFHFHRRFRQRFGITPKAVSGRAQVEAAQRLLAKNIPLVDVAWQCGFANQSHMTQRFRQLVGITPSRWRRAQRMATAAVSARVDVPAALAA